MKPVQISSNLNPLSSIFPLMRRIFLLLVIACIFLASCSDSSVYVSVSGDDQQTGTRSKPVASLQKAVELTRNLSSKKIVVTGGEYHNVSVVLNEQDSGLVITGEPGKIVKLYGGKNPGKWTRNGEWLEMNIPVYEWPELDFRVLIINDTLRNRARLPETGAFTHKNEWPHSWQSSQGGWSVTPTEKDLTTLYYNPSDIGSWLDVNNAEITVFHAWDDSYVGVSSIDTMNNSLIFSHKTTHPAGAYASWAGEKTRQYIVWNIKEGMKKPGQWFVDRTNRKIVYWPYPHENPENLKTMIPVHNHLFRLEKGTSNIRIENLQFSCAGAPITNTGYGTNNITGAIIAEEVKGVTFKNIQVKNVAGWAAKLSGKNITVEDCEFSYTGAGGLYYNGKNIEVIRSGLHDLGKLYFGAVGIMGSGKSNRVAHCELYNIPYCAINGLGKSSIAEFNLIYDFKQMMVDGGAIYCYGGDSTIYRNNAVLFSNGNTTEGWSYYFDELSVNCFIENNLALNTIVPLHHHMADGITMRNNIFIDEGHQKISYPLSSNLKFSGNTFVADEILFSGPTGEIGSTEKSTLNPVFQNYFDCNGITGFEENIFYTNNIRHDVLHIYNKIRTEDFNLAIEEGNTIRLNEPPAIPEYFRQTGYRENFDQVYSSMTREKN